MVAVLLREELASRWELVVLKKQFWEKMVEYQSFSFLVVEQLLCLITMNTLLN